MTSMIKIGGKAPDFCLPDHNNRNVCLQDFKGQWLVLYFYPKDNTSGCTKEAVDFSEHLKEFGKFNAVVIGVSPDSIQSHVNFIRKHNLKVLLLSDPEHKVLKQYAVWQKKMMYGKEYYGVVRTTFVIDQNGNIAHIWQKVKVDGHVNDVRHKLGEYCSIKS